MKLSRKIKIFLTLALVFIIPIFWNQTAVIAYAASPTFAEDEIELSGVNSTYQMEILNEVANSTYKWSTSKASVAKVSSKGVITAVNKGKATIKCKITYPSGKTKTLSCVVRVTIPATSVKINNAKVVNGAHILEVGQQFNFNRDIVPSNSSDKTFWSIGGGDEGCLRIDNNSNGIVTALKPGKVILVATAVKELSQAHADRSFVNDAIIIEVVGPSAKVNSARIADSTVIKVEFDSPVVQNTVIDNNGKLTDNVQITLKPNSKGVLAGDPGELKASLSADGKTLTITSTKQFTGEYGINLSSGIKTTNGANIDPYYTEMTYTDTMPPTIQGVTLDDTGKIVTITFNEVIDFTDFKASNAAVLPTQGTNTSVEQSTLAILNNRMNYTISEDKRSLEINLSKIAPNDLGKTFSVVLSGIKDMAGNYPANYSLTAYLYTDITPKPQARPLKIERTAYDTITATFDRSIELPGWGMVNNIYVNGVVDDKDRRKVNYTLTGTTTELTGNVVVSIGYWQAYNVIETDTYSNQMSNFNVNFDFDKSSPVLMKYEFDPNTSILKLTYNKDVDLRYDTGIFNTVLYTTTDDILSGTNIAYTKVIGSESNVIELKLTNMTLIGTYTFTMEKGFVIDKFNNESLERPMSISNFGGSSSELSGPYAITQSTTNPSHIFLEFANKLDVASAETLSNYYIAGVNLVEAKVIRNTDEGATVRLTVAESSIDVTLERPITVKGVKGYNASYAPISEYKTTILLKDNKKPVFMSTAFDRTGLTTVHLNFNEEVQGTLSIRVTQKGTMERVIGATVAYEGNSVVIILDSIPDNNSYLIIEILDGVVTDLSGNEGNLDKLIYVPVSYQR